MEDHIIIEAVEIELINKYAQGSKQVIDEIKHNFWKIKQFNYANNKEIQFYADGLYTKATNTIDCKMGCGWLIPEEDISFSFSTSKWPSSTRAELMAIWSILLTVPIKSKLNIMTDSAAAIQGIEKGRNISWYNKWLSINNRSIISCIIYLK